MIKEKQLEELREAAGKLQDNHFEWIINAALDHFQKKICDLENEIVRHEHFSDEVFYDYQTLSGTRQEKIDRARSYLGEYRNIVAFLRALSRVSSEFSARKFAQEVVVIFKNKKQ